MRTPKFVKRWKRKRDGMRKSPLTGVFRSVAQPFNRAWTWFGQARKKRSYKNLWWGLPAVVLGGLAVLFGLLASFGADRHDRTYRGLAMEAYETADFKSARVYLERVYRNGGTGKKMRYALASVLSGQGEHQRANAIIESLAPDDAFGYPEAHMLKAKALVTRGTFATGREAAVAKHHLQSCRARFDKGSEWHTLMGRYYLIVEQPEDALRHIKAAADIDPALLYDLGMLYKKFDRVAAAGPTLDLARAHFERVIAEGNAENRQQDLSHKKALLNLGAILSEQGDFQGAQKTLKQGLDLDKNKERFGPALASVCLAEYQVLLTRENTEPRKRLDLLKDALTFDRTSLAAVRLLAFFGEEAPDASPEVKQNARDFLQFLVATGDRSAIAHFALGSKAWADGDTAQAIFNLRRAYEQDKSMAVLANNLAWALSNQETPELDQALYIMNTLLEDYPNIPQFRDTRGQIFTKQQKWAEALADLEFALRSMQKNALVHASLARVYRNISPRQDELADKHERLSKALATQR